ncbi:DUF4188 domain-containing protein [Paenibacillus sp.]|uniref:DUF4188 domain-containing protein n=1 Tax=Paenibacillus sp. TaxID=58172 RepID=UPI002D267CF2|nr:DUF4188 domain-containing protein [Paenibacillus sp.]HZG84770.1 DUF4188 domain-containing protein [Paenibacillus sp.]
MAKWIPGRYTAQMDESFAVFVIGVRIHQLWKLHLWIPIIVSMQKMITELYRNKELGFLDMKFFVSWRGVTLLQYWKSFEHLEHYSRHAGLHLKAWKDFNRNVADTGAVGFYHESYVVEPGRYECMYVNMPVYGLARAGRHVPVAGRRETARGRMAEGQAAGGTPR